MSKIIDYTVVRSVYDYYSKEGKLSERVKSMIEQGWQPYGNIATVDGKNWRVYEAQPMVKYEE